MGNDKKRGNGEGSVFYRKSARRWVAKCVMGRKADGKLDVQTKTCRTEADAKRALRLLLEEKHKNDYVQVQRGTVQEFMTTWLTTVKRVELKPKSYDRLEQTLEFSVFPHIGWINVSEIQSSDIQQMMTKLFDQNLACSTINKAYDAVNACFRWGMEQNPPKVRFNPTVGVKKIKKSKRPPKSIVYYTKEEATALSDAALKAYPNGTRYYRLGAAIILALNTGLRLGELVALEWDRDIDWERKTLTVNKTVVRIRDRTITDKKAHTTQLQASTKTESGQGRTIPLNEDAILALKDLYAATGEFPYVLATRNGTRTSERDVDRLLRRIARMAGLPEEKIYGPHALRHTFATLLFYNGVDIKVISKLLGHSDVSVTYNTYIHVIKEIEINALDMLPRLTAPTKKDH